MQLNLFLNVDHHLDGVRTVLVWYRSFVQYLVRVLPVFEYLMKLMTAENSIGIVSGLDLEWFGWI